VKPKYLISNLCYGDMYATLFCDQHLKSLLDETNLPDLVETYDVTYMILTDDETLPLLQNHPNMQRLSQVLKTNGENRVQIIVFSWGAVKDKFSRRYTGLLDLFKMSVKKALDEKFDYLTAWVADLVVAKDFYPKVMKQLEAGHGAVFVQPPRAAAESIIEHLENFEQGLPALKLWKLCYEHMHPLWWACHWDNPCFTRLPFQLLWNNGKGIRCHSYSTTPIIFKPNEKMLDGRGMIDGDIPSLCENPFWATDWTDAPVIGVEPLFCYYPTFKHERSSIEFMRDTWNHQVHPSQVKFLEKALYYPNRETVGELDVKDIPGQIVQGFVPKVIETKAEVEAPKEKDDQVLTVPLNRELRRKLERQAKKGHHP
jgi:hypothetical protein